MTSQATDGWIEARDRPKPHGMRRFGDGPGYGITVSLRIFLALLILCTGGALLLLLPGMTSHPLTFMDAVFTATSAAAVTGLTVVPTGATFTLAGQVVILLLVQLGGVGLIYAVMILLRVRNPRLTLVDRMTLAQSMGLEGPGSIASLVGRSALLMLGIEAGGALLLYLHWSAVEAVPAADAAWYAVFHSVTAFCNAGFDLFSGLASYPGGIPGDRGTSIILGVIIILGGLGYPLFMDAVLWRRDRRLSLNSRITLVVSAALILLGTAGLLLAESRPGGILHGYGLVDRLVHAWFQSVSARTAGFAGLDDFSAMTEGSRLLLAALMFIGTAPASMGGGITTGTFVVLTLALVSFARGFSEARVGGRAIPDRIVLRASAVLMFGLFTVLAATWLLLLVQRIPLDGALFEVVSAFSTTGLSLGVTDQLSTAGRWIIIVMMFWGRLGASTVVLLLVQRRRPQESVKYPEARVFVG
jgi:trk system potassium uptake protein TrkH